MSSKSHQSVTPDGLAGGNGGSQHDDTDAAQSDETAADETDDATAELSLDHIFEILKNERRRTVLHYLADQEGTVSLGELAEHVAAVENDTTVARVTSKERKCVYVGLYQCHLPKMDDMDIVSFNQNRGRIEIGPNAEALYTYLDVSDSRDRPWPLYYGSVAALGGALLLLSHVGASTLGLTPTVVAMFALIGVSTCAALELGAREDDD